MARFLNEEQVEKLLTVRECWGPLEEAMLAHGRGSAKNVPRNIVKTDKVGLSVLQASVPELNKVGFKAYTTCPDGVRFWVMLFDGEGGNLEAIVEAEHLGLVRTAAASGIATKHLANPGNATVGILGTGFQAAAQLEAVCMDRKVDRVYAWSRTPENAKSFADRMSRTLDLEVVAASSAKAAVVESDIIVTITSSRTPVLEGDWLKPGAHVNLVGAMKPTSREVDDRTLARADLLTVDDWHQAHKEAGEYIEATDAGVISWDDVKEIGAVMAGAVPGRSSPNDITVFKSHGIGIWDVAAGKRVLDLAVAQNIGAMVPIEQNARPLGRNPDPYRLKP